MDTSTPTASTAGTAATVALTQERMTVNYGVELEKCTRFIEKFTATKEKKKAEDMTDEEVLDMADEAAAGGLRSGDETFKYMDMLDEIKENKRTSITIQLDDVLAFGADAAESEAFVQRIKADATTYIDLFYKAIDSLLPSPQDQPVAEGDVFGTYLTHRMERLALNTNGETINPKDHFPPSLLRKYHIYLSPSTSGDDGKCLSVRQVRAQHLGHLVKVRGIVVRVSEVNPRLVVNTYTCDTCGNEIYEEVTAPTFNPLTECPSAECRTNGVRGRLFMQSRGSRFQRFQEVKLQELADQVPMGHTPRSITLSLTGDICRTMNAGDHVSVAGIYLPRAYTGFQAIRAGLLTDTYLSIQQVTSLKQSYHLMDPTPAETAAVAAIRADPHVYTRLAKSIAPEIWGMLDVKKALLLQMVSGVTKKMGDGMKIRGDVNICLMGDPGVAKSQLLKYISKAAPRGVYTTGKGSSGVGLTAAVLKDPVTQAMVLEGGALVLADNGICCIDEFDKMDDSDRTSIHEVMEQQTISISKAGITTTLNARASILAAANPLYGRYHVGRSVRENINLPYSLLSRFDLMFVLLDTPGIEDDTRLAEHVAHVHRYACAPALDFEPVGVDLLRLYVAEAKKYEPVVPESLMGYLCGVYVGMRANDTTSGGTAGAGASSTGGGMYTTPRTLLAILRLSQALAKLRFSSLVSQADVDEALRLMDASRASIQTEAASQADKAASRTHPITRIYALIRDMAGKTVGNAKEIMYNEIRERVRQHGFTDAQLSECIDEFDASNIWSLTHRGTRLRIYN